MVARQRLRVLLRPYALAVLFALMGYGLLLTFWWFKTAEWLNRVRTTSANARKLLRLMSNGVEVFQVWGPLLMTLVLLLAIGLGTWQYLRFRTQFEQFGKCLTTAESAAVFVLPRGDLKAVDVSSVRLWERLVDVIPFGEHLAWELVGGETQIAYLLRGSQAGLRPALNQVMTEWVGTNVRPVKPEDDPLQLTEGQHGFWVQLQPASAELPILPGGDPLLTLLTELARLPQGVSGGLQILARGDPYTRQNIGNKAARMSATPGTGKSLEQKRQEKWLDTRAQRMFLESQVTVWGRAASAAMAASVARSLARSLSAQFGAANPLRQVGEGEGLPDAVFPPFDGMPWADNELAALAHLVGADGRQAAPPLWTASARALPPSKDARIPKDVRTAIPI